MRNSPLEAWIARLVTADSAGDTSSPFDRAALERYQLRRLRETLRLARTHSVFYRRHLAGAAEGLRSLEDLQGLPLTTADDIRANPLSFVCVSQDEINRVVTLDSSGTTGAPKRVYFTRADQRLTVDFFGVGMSTFTNPGDRVLILLPVERPGSVGDLLATAMLELGAVPIRYGPVRDPEHALQVAADERASVMVGVPTHLLRLVRHRLAAPRLPRLHSVLLSTDHVPTAIVNAVETAWGCRVYNHYGTTEMGLGGGVDCAASRGYHLRDADLLFEIVDPASGRPVVGEEIGEVTFTTLTRTGMPLIRYRTGDLSRWLLDPCPCGSRLRTLAHITTRVAGQFALGPGSTLTQADLDEAIFAVDGVLDFSAKLSRAEAATELQIRVQVSPHRDLPAAHDDTVLALRAVPALARAASSRDLDSIEVVVGTDRASEPTLAKRSIAVDVQ
jgi:phenylacetate-coenzyme A ligase PaaK-like adenylate-forming protein